MQFCAISAGRSIAIASADVQVAWDANDIQCLGILGLCLSPNLRTHLGNTACLTWDSLNTMFGQPGVSAIFADYQAAISLKVTGGQNLQVEIQQLNTLFKRLVANGMSISDPMQEMILVTFFFTASLSPSSLFTQQLLIHN